MKIVTLADIHIKNSPNEKLLKYLFKRLVEKLSKYSNLDFIIVLGDLVDSKTSLSPYSVKYSSLFLKILLKFANVIMIKGNHDCSKNPDVLDSLSPIVDLVNEQNHKHKIYYYTKSQIVDCLPDIDFVIFDYMDSENYPNYQKNKDKKSIGLFHGVPYPITITNGIVLPPEIDEKYFDNLDYLFVGDIHQTIYWNDEKTFFMNGSFYQQSFNEKECGHGFHYIDTDSETVEFEEIVNEYYGFVTLTDNDVEKIDDKVVKLTRKNKYQDCTVRCILDGEYTDDQLIHLKKEIKREFKKDITISVRVDITEAVKEFNVLNLSDVNVQNALIKDYCKINKIGRVKELLEVNKAINDEIKKTDSLYYVKWLPLELKWRNFFSYGEHENYVDFRKLKGITAIIGKNRTGKSSILNIILFALYSNSPKINKIEEAINERKDNAFLEFTIQIENDIYKIIKELERKKGGKVSTSLTFEKLNKKTNKFEIEDRDTNTDTKQYIIQLMGIYDDVLTSTFSMQGETEKFLNSDKSERRSYINKFIGLNIFERLYKQSSTYENSFNSVINAGKINDYESEIQTKRMSIQQQKDSVDAYKLLKLEEEEKLELLEKELKDKLVDLEVKKKGVHSVKEYDGIKNRIFQLNSDISVCEKQIQSYKKKLELEEESIEKIKKVDVEKCTQDNQKGLDEINRELTKLNSSDEKLTKIKEELEKKRENNKSVKEKITKIELKIKELEINISSYKRQTEILQKQPWMVDNELCKTCELSKDAFLSLNLLTEKQGLLEKSKAVQSQLKLNYDDSVDNQIKEKNEEIKKQNILIKKYNDEKSSKLEEINNLQKISNKLELLKKSVENINTQLVVLSEKLNNLKDEHLEKSVKLQELEKINKELEDLKYLEKELKDKENDKIKYKKTVNEYVDNINKLNTSIAVDEEKIITLTEKFDEYNNALSQKVLYETYRKIVHRNGLPSTVLENFIPSLNKSVNNYLEDIVNFKVEFKLEDENLRIYMFTDENYKRDVKSCSGFEKTILSFSIRASLSEYSILPKADIIIFDEGFGTMDEENLQKFTMFFDKIKSKFSKVFIISHIPTIQEFANNFIEIGVDSEDFSFVKV